MERVTGATFLAEEPPSVASALCAEGLRRQHAFLAGGGGVASDATGASRPRQCPR
jgi:hypothetical protein